MKPALRRPSLPRPGSPLRQNAPTPAVSTPSARPSAIGFSKSRIGAGPRFTPSASRTSTFGASLRNGLSTPSKQVNLGPEAAFDESPEQETTPTPTPIGVARTIDQTVSQEEVKRLKAQVDAKDRQLSEQAAALTDMEKTLTELQTYLPSDDQPMRQQSATDEPSDVTQLRQLLREKNEKISMLTAEFDAHRADFRSTIDTLEMASTETERVYEKRVDELLQEIRELQDRGEDVQSVAIQLKQLEELVQELEEGLEDARRGEAEARGEVEHLRGEVERTRMELEHEKEKSVQARKSGSSDGNRSSKYVKDLEAKDDEIRGLKAIIHSFSRENMLSPGGTHPVSSAAQVNGEAPEDSDHVIELERQVKELKKAVEGKASREEELEREVERLRTTISLEGTAPHPNSNRLSERTVVPSDWHQPNGTRQPMETMQEDAASQVSKSTIQRCELCDEDGHDILNCKNVFGNRPGSAKASEQSMRTGKDVVEAGLKLASASSPPRNDTIAPLRTRSPPIDAPAPPIVNGTINGDKPTTNAFASTTTAAAADEEKWCAVCDSEEHNTMECPYEATI